MGAEQLPDDIQMFGLIDPDTARSAGRRRCRAPKAPMARDRFRFRISDDGRNVGSRIQDAIGEPLEEMRLVRRHSEMMQLHLSLGPGQRGRAVERRGVVMLVGES